MSVCRVIIVKMFHKKERQHNVKTNCSPRTRMRTRSHTYTEKQGPQIPETCGALFWGLLVALLACSGVSLFLPKWLDVSTLKQHRQQCLTVQNALIGQEHGPRPTTHRFSETLCFFLQGTLVKQCETLLLRTLALLRDTLVGHSCRALMWETLFGTGL